MNSLESRQRKARENPVAGSDPLEGLTEVAALFGGVVREAPRPGKHLDRVKGNGPELVHESKHTRADGRFALPDVPAAAVLVWAATPESLLAVSDVLQVDAGETTDLELTLAPLPPGEQVAGLVVDQAGEPVPHAELGIRPMAGHESALVSDFGASISNWRRGGRTLVADGEGRFRFSPRYLSAHSIVVLGSWDQPEVIVLEPVVPGSTSLRVVIAAVQH